MRYTLFYITTVCEVSTTVHFKVKIKILNLKRNENSLILTFFGYYEVWRRIQV